MEIDFNDIRCFSNEEVHGVLEKLLEEKRFMKVLSTVYPLLPKEIIKQRLLSYHSSYDFQKDMIYPFLQYLEANMTKGIELNGLDKTDTSKPHLYISNHRDIILDSAHFCGKLIEKEMNTVEIAIGDNLLIFPWIEQLVRVNKSFIVKRGLSARQILESSQKLSAYIHYTINKKNQSIWLAQREGRAKDSNDRTQESLLKMLNMSGKKSLIANLKELNICPLSISYEYDPCDYLKAKEMQQKHDDPFYKKQAHDDLLNMQTGVMGYRGKVYFEVTGDISNELEIIEQTSDSKNEQIALIAAAIDKKIHANYHIFSNNKIAYDLLTGEKRFESDYTTMEKLDFEKYISIQIGKIDLANRDDAFLTKRILEMYANPLINHLEAIS